MYVPQLEGIDEEGSGGGYAGMAVDPVSHVIEEKCMILGEADSSLDGSVRVDEPEEEDMWRESGCWRCGPERSKEEEREEDNGDERERKLRRST